MGCGPSTTAPAAVEVRLEPHPQADAQTKVTQTEAPIPEPVPVQVEEQQVDSEPKVKKIVVTGATGAQGGAVVEALLASGHLSDNIRAVTRDPGSPAALKLFSSGVEVVQGSYDDPDSMVAAFQGCDAAFLLTSFFETMDSSVELQQGKTLADACKAAGIEHAVWSALEDTRAIMPEGAEVDKNGYWTPHMDAKADVTKYMVEQDVPVTVLLTCHYYDNFLKVYKLAKQADDLYIFPMLDVSAAHAEAWVSVEDIGRGAAAILLQGREAWAGKTVGLSGDIISFENAMNIISELAGKQVKVVPMDRDTYISTMTPFMGPATTEFANMFTFFATNEFNEARPLSTLQELIETPESFAAWAEKNKEQLIATLFS